jgi:hypothetical protein
MATNSQTSRVNPLKLNDVNETAAGGVLTSGTGTAQAFGQLGKTVEFADANEIFYDSTVGTLYPGKYQYVQTDSESSDSPARGLIAFWLGDPTDYVVTPDAQDGEIAGIYINALTKGNYGYIQIEGIASVQFDASQSQGTPAVKDLVVQKSTANTADAIADGTTVTAGIAKRVLGIAYDAPVANVISRVELYEKFLNK